MKQFNLFLFIFICLLTGCNSTNSKNSQSVEAELETILKRHEAVHSVLYDAPSETTKQNLLEFLNIQEDDFNSNQLKCLSNIEEDNLNRIEEIIQEYDYPSEALKSEMSNEAIYTIILNSDKIGTYLPNLREAAKIGDISYQKLAILEDYYFMHQGLPQTYGTQVRGYSDETCNWTQYIWPVDQPDSINSRRKAVGLSTIEEYTKNLGFDYKVVTMEDVESFSPAIID